jgi:outer membrane lipoprotein SlyB
MRRLTTAVLTLAALAAAGCAGNTRPIVDMQGVDREAFEQDLAECESYADEVQMGKGVAKGTGLGAAIGAVAGAIGGDSSDVAEGAAYGGLWGGTESGLDADREKQLVIKRCMAGRGYRVLN